MGRVTVARGTLGELLLAKRVLRPTSWLNLLLHRRLLLLLGLEILLLILLMKLLLLLKEELLLLCYSFVIHCGRFVVSCTVTSGEGEGAARLTRWHRRGIARRTVRGRVRAVRLGP